MLSIIIPALDEATTITKTISALQRMGGDAEIIVADGGSTDATRKLAEKLRVKVVKAERGVVPQLIAGVTHAKGDRYLFLHADTIPPEGAIELLNEASGAGGFLHRYDRFGLLGSLQAGINNLNARLFRRFSGEQAFFLTKEALEEIKGLPDAPAFETERLCERLRKAGITPQVFPGKAVSSDRRLAAHGLLGVLRLHWAHALHGLGADPLRLKRHVPKVR